MRALLSVKTAMSITIEQFVERLTQSGLMSAQEIDSFHKQLPPDKRPKDVQQLAQALVQKGKLTKYQAQAVYQGKTKGLVFGEYVVVDKLGEGGMGVVLKAQHRRMKRFVAVKMIAKKAVGSPDAVKRFYREVEAAAKLMHPNIVAAHDAGEHEGVHYMVMEYVEGKDLAAIVKEKGPLRVSQAVECILQAARGLQYAHAQGIVHRDIKPSNLLLTIPPSPCGRGAGGEGVVKILDMGLARIAGLADDSDQDRLTSSGQVMGTSEYMAPEQAMDTHHADGRADIYSLGCTLYRLLTGHVPYKGETLVQILMAHQQAPVPSLCQARPDVPPQLDAVFRKMVAKRPEDRQQTMAEVVARLETVLSGSSAPAATAAAVKAESSSGALAATLAFLQEGRAVSAVAAPVKTTAEETQPSVSGQETGTNILGKLLRTVAKTRRRPLLLAGLGGGLVLLLGIVLTIALRHGTLTVEIDQNLGKDVQVTVSQGGEEVRLVDAKSGWTLSLSAGKYDLAVQGGDDQFQLDSESIVVTRGGEAKVKVTLKPASPAVAPFDAQQARKHQECWARQLGVPVEITNSIGMKLTLIPPGEFMMGSPKELIEEELKARGDDQQWYKDSLPAEGPQHLVRITRLFYLGVYLVMQQEYQQVTGANPSVSWATGKDKDRVAGQDTKRFPVDNVSWDDAVEFCRKLSEMPAERAAGRTYRLPSEAQWEYACRAGNMGRYGFSLGKAVPKEYDESAFSDYGWFGGNSRGMPHAVGGKKPNAWGLYDMHGNVCERCQDWFDKEYYTSSPTNDPVGPSKGSYRVVRGGCWVDPAWRCRSAGRNHFGAGDRPYLGFRVSLALADTAAERAKTESQISNLKSPIPPPSAVASLAVKNATLPRVELEPEPVTIKPGGPLSEMALVVGPAALEGVRSWSIETIGPRGAVNALAYSPDGTRLATGGDDGTLRIWDPATGKLLRAILGAGPIAGLCWSPDGGMLAVEVDRSHKAMILDVDSALPLRCELPGFSGTPCGVLRWSADGRRIAYGRKNGDVVIATFPPSHDAILLCGAGGAGDGLLSLAWSRDGTAVATFSRDGGTCIWDAASGTQGKQLNDPAPHSNHATVAWSPDGTMLAVVRQFGKAAVWDTKTWQLRRSFPVEARVAAWSPDSRTVAFGGADRGIEARDAQTGGMRWSTQDSSHSSFTFSRDGETLAVAFPDGNILFRDAATGEQRSEIRGHRSFDGYWFAELLSEFSPDGTRLITGEYHEMRSWDLKTGGLIGECHPRGGVDGIAWSADGKTIATDGNQIWDAASREHLKDVPAGSWGRWGHGLSPDGTRLANDDNKMVRFWDLAAGRQMFEVPLGPYSLSPDGKTLAVAAEKAVKLYETTNGAPTGALEGAAQRPTCLAWSPTGKTLAAVDRKTIHLWDVASGRHTVDSTSLSVFPWPSSPAEITSACWLDEETLALGNTCGACVWDRRKHTILRTLHGIPVPNTQMSPQCRFSPAAHLAAFPFCGLVRLRSLNDGRLLYTLLSLRDDLTGVVSPEGHWRGSPGLEKGLVYVVQTEHGQETLAPEEFAKKYGWKNDPQKAVPKAAGSK